MGDISPNAQGVRVQDVEITGIPLENAKQAIRMCRIKPRRIMSDAQKAVLEKARSLLPPRPPANDTAQNRMTQPEPRKATP